MDSGSAVQRAKRAYAATAQATGVALTRAHILGATPPSLDRRLRHWAYSLTRVHNSLAIAELDVPWWTYRAIDAMSDWLRVQQRPLRAFEYGSGASTFWLARRFDEVHSVEHHKEFGSMMARELSPLANVELRVIEPVEQTDPRIASAKEGHGNLDFYDYVHSIDAVEGRFDLIVVDGRAREACLAVAVSRVKPGGVIVYDNSARRRYRPAIEASGLFERRFRGLTPTLPYPDQTSLLFAERS